MATTRPLYKETCIYTCNRCLNTFGKVTLRCPSPWCDGIVRKIKDVYLTPQGSLGHQLDLFDGN